MTKQAILSMLVRSSHALGTGLTLTAVILVQYNPPSDPPPRRQTSFTGEAQAIERVPLPHFLFRS
ncbi:MAG: hypothetical protein KME45_27735 [Stenomitos rutilans HA7619-LM2]|nr:hypothetical protein [Stenomitos rutilans HA7619-LM2]